MANEGTTRWSRYNVRRERYYWRADKTRGLWPKRRRRDDDPSEYEVRGKIVQWEGDGRKQQSLKTLLVNPPSGPLYPPLFTPYAFVVSKTARSHPPHVKITVDGRPVGHTHHANINFHHRAQKYRGKKIGKLRGADRSNALAVRMSWTMFIDGVRHWPSWDPLHRTPVFPDG